MVLRNYLGGGQTMFFPSGWGGGWGFRGNVAVQGKGLAFKGLAFMRDRKSRGAETSFETMVRQSQSGPYTLDSHFRFTRSVHVKILFSLFEGGSSFLL